MGTTWSSDEAKDSNSQQAILLSHPNPELLTSQNDGEVVLSPTTNNSKISNIHIKPKEAMKILPKLPYNCEAIIKDSDRAIDKSSFEKLYEQLYAGVYLNGRKKKYWVEKKGNLNCFMVFANTLSITWADNANYWHLQNVETSEDGNIVVAHLKNVCWLEVHGKFHISNLTPGITYQVAYLIKLENSCYGWEVPVNLRLTLPNGTIQEHKESLKEKPKEEWVRIPVGEFKVSPENVGDIEFSLYEYEGGSWKKGLLIKGAIIEPKV